MSESTSLRRKGICENPDCDMCLNKTVQEIEPGEDFVCSECEMPLKEIKEGKNKKKKNGSDGSNSLIYIIIAAAVILIGGGAWWFMSSDKTEAPEVVDDITVAGEEETVGIVVDSLSTDGLDTAADVATVNEEIVGTDGNNNSETSGSGNVNSGVSSLKLAYGVYDGPMKNGKADGMGGEFKFTKAMTLELKDGYGTTVELAPGDKIVTTKFTNGKFNQGEIHFTNGTRKYVSGLNQTL